MKKRKYATWTATLITVAEEAVEDRFEALLETGRTRQEALAALYADRTVRPLLTREFVVYLRDEAGLYVNHGDGSIFDLAKSV